MRFNIRDITVRKSRAGLERALGHPSTIANGADVLGDACPKQRQPNVRWGREDIAGKKREGVYFQCASEFADCVDLRAACILFY